MSACLKVAYVGASNLFRFYESVPNILRNPEGSQKIFNVESHVPSNRRLKLSTYRSSSREIHPLQSCNCRSEQCANQSHISLPDGLELMCFGGKGGRINHSNPDFTIIGAVRNATQWGANVIYVFPDILLNSVSAMFSNMPPPTDTTGLLIHLYRLNDDCCKNNINFIVSTGRREAETRVDQELNQCLLSSNLKVHHLRFSNGDFIENDPYHLRLATLKMLTVNAVLQISKDSLPNGRRKRPSGAMRRKRASAN